MKYKRGIGDESEISLKEKFRIERQFEYIEGKGADVVHVQGGVYKTHLDKQ